MDELYEIFLVCKKKISNENKLNHKETKSSKNSDNSHMSRKAQDILNKKIETSLFDVYNKSSDPFWLNLFLIENYQDY